MKDDRIVALEFLANAGKQGPKSDAIIELCVEVRRLQNERWGRTTKPGPSLADVMTYAKEIDLNSGEPEAFFDYHEARGWMLGPRGTAAMRDFKAAMRTWKRRAKPATEKPKTNYGVA